MANNSDLNNFVASSNDVSDFSASVLNSSVAVGLNCLSTIKQSDVLINAIAVRFSSNGVAVSEVISVPVMSVNQNNVGLNNISIINNYDESQIDNAVS